MIKWAENIIFVFGILLIISMTITDIYEAMNGKAESFFRVGAGSSEIRTAVCSRTACPLACRIAAPLEMGVSLAIQQHAVVL